MAKNNNGFTLVEILIAIVITGIAIAGTSSVFISMDNIQQHTNYVDAATRAAQREVEVLRNASYSSLTPGQTINFTSSLPSTLPKNSTGSVAVTEPSDDIRRVDVSVSYKFAGQQKTITLSSLIGAIGITK